MEKIEVPNYEKYKQNSGILGFYLERGLNPKISLGIFAADIEKKLEIAIELVIELLRKYFSVDELDDIAYDAVKSIAYDIVKSYCLSERYCLPNKDYLEDSNAQFYVFFNFYIENLEKITRGISKELSTPKANAK